LSKDSKINLLINKNFFKWMSYTSQTKVSSFNVSQMTALLSSHLENYFSISVRWSITNYYAWRYTAEKYLNDFYLLKTSKLYLLRNIGFTNSVQMSELKVDFGRPVVWAHKSRSIHRTYLKLFNMCFEVLFCTFSDVWLCL